MKRDKLRKAVAGKNRAAFAAAKAASAPPAQQTIKLYGLEDLATLVVTPPAPKPMPRIITMRRRDEPFIRPPTKAQLMGRR